MREDCSNGQDESQCGDCSFERDMCGWENRGQTDYDWVRHNCEEECEDCGYPVCGPACAKAEIHREECQVFQC